MQTRFVVYRAYNRDGYAPAVLVVTAGQRIPLRTIDAGDLAMYRRWSATDWRARHSISGPSVAYWKAYARHYISGPSVAYWKAYARRMGAIRFERFTVLGETR